MSLCLVNIVLSEMIGPSEIVGAVVIISGEELLPEELASRNACGSDLAPPRLHRSLPRALVGQDWREGGALFLSDKFCH